MRTGAEIQSGGSSQLTRHAFQTTADIRFLYQPYQESNCTKKSKSSQVGRSSKQKWSVPSIYSSQHYFSIGYTLRVVKWL